MTIPAAGPAKNQVGDTGDAVYDGVAVPGRSYRVRWAARPRYVATLGLLATGLGVGMLVLAFWDGLVADKSTYRCPPDCGRPPNAVAVSNLPRFVAANGDFSVAYPPPDAPYQVTKQPNGVTAQLTAGDGGQLRLFGEPARGRVARQVVQQLLAGYPNSEVAYVLPNATVGYQLGYGVVANFQPPGVSTNYQRRLIVMAAVKNGLALIGIAEGPFRRFSPEFGPGPPSAANMEIAMDMGKYVESFKWNQQPPK